jgi:hypothetical protein
MQNDRYPHAHMNGFRHISKRQIEILLEKVNDMSCYLLELNGLAPQEREDRDRSTFAYLVFNLRLLQTRLRSFAVYHDIDISRI